MTHARLRVAAGLVLAATSLSGCGGGSGSPKAASTSDFCTAYTSLVTSFAETDPDDPATVVKVLKEWTRRLQDAGLPESLPADARRGVEQLIKTVADLDETATDDQLNDLSGSFTDAQKADGDALTAWTDDKCPPPLQTPTPSAPSPT